MRRVPDEVVERYYGCGSTIPMGIEGLDVLDLGSGSGRDCYVAAQLVRLSLTLPTHFAVTSTVPLVSYSMTIFESSNLPQL